MKKQPTPKPPKHCWHPSGHGVTLGWGLSGYDYVECCWCPAYGKRNWRYEDHEVDGHGPNVSYQAKVVDDVTNINAEAEADCPGPPPADDEDLD